MLLCNCIYFCRNNFFNCLCKEIILFYALSHTEDQQILDVTFSISQAYSPRGSLYREFTLTVILYKLTACRCIVTPCSLERSQYFRMYHLCLHDCRVSQALKLMCSSRMSGCIQTTWCCSPEGQGLCSDHFKCRERSVQSELRRHC
jgi:hypothetical protein